jgi:hypothetical protein
MKYQKLSLVFLFLISYNLQGQKLKTLNNDLYKSCLIDIDQIKDSRFYIVAVKTNNKGQIVKAKRGFVINSDAGKCFQSYFNNIQSEKLEKKNWFYYDADCYDILNIKDTVLALELVEQKKADFEKNVFWNHKDDFGVRLQVYDGGKCFDCGKYWELTLAIPSIDGLKMGTQIDVSIGNIRAEFKSRGAFFSGDQDKRQIYGQFTPMAFDGETATIYFKVYVRDFWTNELIIFEGKRILKSDN